MSTLTESVLIYNFYNSDNNKSNNSNPKKNTWYDRVYLCLENRDPSQFICKFDCYSFKSYEKADEYSKSIGYIYQDNKIRHTMVPMCKWIPNRFHSYFLNKTLRNMYWKGVNIL
jgi:hypothetical protein